MRHSQTVFFALTPQKSNYHFGSKWAVLKLDRWKVNFLSRLGNRKQCNIEHYFCSQNSTCFSLNTISSFTTKLKQSKSYEQKYKNSILFVF